MVFGRPGRPGRNEISLWASATVFKAAPYIRLDHFFLDILQNGVFLFGALGIVIFTVI